MTNFDVTIVGGGIVGLATAHEISQRHPQLRLCLLEKESAVGAHQTGHNSGVLHSGIYYKPGSLKAINCREGKRRMETFCADEGIPYDVCGKVIVAVDRNEIGALEKIYQRGQENGVQCRIISKEELAELEPHTAGVKAIHVPEAGIVNYRRVAERLAELLSEAGHDVRTGCRVISIRKEAPMVVETKDEEIASRYVINCTGLHCDRVLKTAGLPSDSQIVPFRGEFYMLKPDAQHLCRNLIYPVPNPAFPFLGVHFTRMIDGGVECGPNAVLAFAREGYTKYQLKLNDLMETLGYRGFQKLAAKYWQVGLGELHRSFSKGAFVKALQRLMPEIRSSHLVPARAGVRAQAIDAKGNMVDDFVVQEHGHLIHVGNAPSPAATSSLNIGSLVADRLDKCLD